MMVEIVPKGNWYFCQGVSGNRLVRLEMWQGGVGYNLCNCGGPSLSEILTELFGS
jgi:hypothetical protein